MLPSLGEVESNPLDALRPTPASASAALEPQSWPTTANRSMPNASMRPIASNARIAASSVRSASLERKKRVSKFDRRRMVGVGDQRQHVAGEFVAAGRIACRSPGLPRRCRPPSRWPTSPPKTAKPACACMAAVSAPVVLVHSGAVPDHAEARERLVKYCVGTLNTGCRQADAEPGASSRLGWKLATVTDTSLLRHLLDAAEEGSFAAVARDCEVVSPFVARRVAALTTSEFLKSPDIPELDGRCCGPKSVKKIRSPGPITLPRQNLRCPGIKRCLPWSSMHTLLIDLEGTPHCKPTH